MKETTCDCCGAVIDGYYPNKEMMADDMYCHDIRLPGELKETIDWKLLVDCRHKQAPVEFHFCSAKCLQAHSESIGLMLEKRLGGHLNG